MPAPSTSLELADWANPQQAAFAYAEQIRAYNRLPAQRILPAPWWLLIDQTGAERAWRRPPESVVTRCHLVDLVELDPHGTTAILNHGIGNIPEATYIVICPWDAAPQAATHLRVHYLSRAFYSCSALTEHVGEACYRLDIPKRFTNDARLPNCSRIRCGTLFRLDSNSAKTFRRYFCLPDHDDVSEPVAIELGADCYLLYAVANDSQEPFRAIITDSLFLPPAKKEINRWIRSNSRTERKDVRTAVRRRSSS